MYEQIEIWVYFQPDEAARYSCGVRAAQQRGRQRKPASRWRAKIQLSFLPKVKGTRRKTAHLVKPPQKRGRKPLRPAWIPPKIWDAARKRLSRAGAKVCRETVIAQAEKLLESLRNASPSAIAKQEEISARMVRTRREWKADDQKAAAEQKPRVIERVAIPRDRVSSQMRQMVIDGRMPGLSWDPDRGVLSVTVRLPGKAR